MDKDAIIMERRKKRLLKVIGRVIKANRLELQKGINKFSFEYDIGNGLLSRLERGDTDTKISTLWKLANAFDMKLSDLIILVENELPKNFSFYE